MPSERFVLLHGGFEACLEISRPGGLGYQLGLLLVLLLWVVGSYREMAGVSSRQLAYLDPGVIAVRCLVY